MSPVALFFEYSFESSSSLAEGPGPVVNYEVPAFNVCLPASEAYQLVQSLNSPSH
jgi:hypothetical protein